MESDGLFDSNLELCSAAMAEFKHLVIAEFKEDVNVEEILKGMEKLVSDIDEVKSFEWGKDMEGEEMLRQGFSYVFLMTFEKKEDFVKFAGHPKHLEFSSSFSVAIEKIILLDFPSVLVKPVEPAAVEPQSVTLPEPPLEVAPEPPLEVTPEAESAVA